MNLIEQDRFYKADIFIDIDGNVHYNKIIKIYKNKLNFYEKIKENYIDLSNYIIFPSFVNAHTHLELTDIDKSKLNFSSFVDWLISLIKAKREKSENFLLQSYCNGRKLLAKYNIKNFGNIISDFLVHRIPLNDLEYNFVEIIEYKKENIEEVKLNYHKISPHSFYSVHPDLIKIILQLNIPKSVHFFESKEEYDYLLNFKGEIIDKLYKFTLLKPIKYNFDFIVDFLKNVKNIQLVHISNFPDELKNLIIKRKNEIFYTLCPRSNATFGIKSPYRFFIENRIPFSLGTDSLCSNNDLNVLNEAKFIFEDLKDDFDNEFLAKQLFLSLTKWGYKAIFSWNIDYVYVENFSGNKFSFKEFLLSLINSNFS